MGNKFGCLVGFYCIAGVWLRRWMTENKEGTRTGKKKKVAFFIHLDCLPTMAPPPNKRAHHDRHEWSVRSSCGRTCPARTREKGKPLLSHPGQPCWQPSEDRDTACTVGRTCQCRSGWHYQASKHGLKAMEICTKTDGFSTVWAKKLLASAVGGRSREVKWASC